MATFVLVHGARHGGWCLRKVTALRRDAGRQIHRSTLTGPGERAHLLAPHIDLETHVQEVLGVLHCEELRDTMPVGHSYGGMVIMDVAAASSPPATT